MALQLDGIADLAKAVLDEPHRGEWTNLGTDLQDHPAATMLLREKSVKVSGGTAVKVRFANGTSGAARNVGMYSIDNVNQADRMVEGSVPWRHTETSYTWDLHEFDANMGTFEVYNLIEERIDDGDVDMVKLIESDFWGRPTSSTDTVTPFGLGYWLVYNATEGFNGADQTGFAAGPAGIDSGTYTRWKNYTAQYTNISKTDLVRKMRKAAYKVNFKAPRPSPGGNLNPRFGYYTNYDVEEQFSEILEGQNQNLGFALDPMDGKVVFRSNPVVVVSQLDANADDPVCGIDWDVFQFMVLRGWNMRKSQRVAPDQHNVVRAWTDLSYNTRCTNRRGLFLIAKGDPWT